MDNVPRCHACKTAISESNTDVLEFKRKYERVCKKCFRDLKKCYVCNATLIYTSPDMILWNGIIKKVCNSCYKCVEGGIATYQEKNPDWQRPTANED